MAYKFKIYSLNCLKWHLIFISMKINWVLRYLPFIFIKLKCHKEFFLCLNEYQNFVVIKDAFFIWQKKQNRLSTVYFTENN